MQAGLGAFKRRWPGRWTMLTLESMCVWLVVLDGWWREVEGMAGWVYGDGKRWMDTDGGG